MDDDAADKTVYTTSEAARRLRIPPLLLRWVCLTGGFGREQAGHQKLLHRDVVAAIDAYIDRHDPHGRFRADPGVKHRARRYPVNTES